VSVGVVALAGALGVLVGSVIAVVAWRVPRGVPLRAGVPADGTLRRGVWVDVPVAHLWSWRGGWDRTARRVAVGFPVLELATAALWVLMCWLFVGSWALPAYLLLAAAAVLLSVIDVQHQRLPNVITVPFAAGSLALLGLAAAGEHAWQPLLRAIVGGAALFVVYLVMALISPASLGMGDVKLAGVLGLYLAYLSWRTLLLGAAGGFVIAAAVGIVLLATRRANRGTQVPFGPSMIAAALVAVVFGADAHGS
jgi:leader peptidase (prepilin peptidase)/N-methyltransferase